MYAAVANLDLSTVHLGFKNNNNNNNRHCHALFRFVDMHAGKHMYVFMFSHCLLAITHILLCTFPLCPLIPTSHFH